ncbi:LysR family transcriptional regulator [Bacillus sp. FJAT-42315]|uniref:LysR family transcriptional regulator n=1 Tax=Bacillus sp. FJAT-42315 TaxID=2014077 RepID=UPI000C24AB78|nr:LysR family transcriptional regulator [Bacillus sp. FJAT-42315]
MNIESLRLFCLVVKEGNMTRAAKLSYISQPAVTKQMRQLEDEYAALLFDRTEGGLKLTAAGEKLYPFAKAIVEDFNRSKEAVKQVIKGNQAFIHVGASYTIGEYLLPGLLGTFKKQMSDVQFSLHVANTPSVLEALADDKIDLALVEGLVEQDGFLVEKFADDLLVLICAPDHPWGAKKRISVGELADEPMIWREALSGTRLIVEHALQSIGMLAKITSQMEIGSTQAIKGAVEAGLGVSILSRLTVAKELNEGRLCEVTIEELDLVRDLWLVQKPKRYPREHVEAFKQFIQR